MNFSELKESSKYFLNYLIILFAGIKTLITFAPAFIAKFIQELLAIEYRVKKELGIEGGRKDGLRINCDKIPKKFLV